MQNDKSKLKNYSKPLPWMRLLHYRYSRTFLLFTLSFFILIFNFSIPLAHAADPVTDPNSSAFKIVICDGPTLPTGENAASFDKFKENFNEKNHHPYVPCDFNHFMLQIQHIINVLMILGVLAAILGFSWAGFLYITGDPGKIKQAHAIFPKVFGGLIIMLSAWFIVYQILSWLTDNPGFKTLLGSPS